MALPFLKMKIDRKRIYWIIVSMFLTAFGAFELHELLNTYINDSRATKTSTLPLDAKFLSESLGMTICTQLRPNLTYLKAKNISENLFNYALAFYQSAEDESKVVGDPNRLQLELANVLH